MKLLRLVALAAWFTVALALPAHAGFVAAAIGWLTSTAIGKLVFGIALQVGLSLLQKALAPKQQEPGITGQVQVGGTQPLSFIIGTYATAGHLEYIGTWGRAGKTPNAGLAQVLTLSDMPVTAISNNVWVDGEAVTRNTSVTGSNSHAYFGSGSHPFNEYFHNKWYYLFAKYYLGNQTSADAQLTSRFGGTRAWSGDMIGRGVAYVILSAEIRREFFKGIPTARWQVDGIRLYDPRKDSTVGGSGSHRWGQESTYEFSNNPAVIIYNILRGIYYQGTWVYGPELPAHALPLSNWIAAMNECDRAMPLSGGGTEPQFRAGYEIRADMQPLDVIQELLKTCNGEMAELGGTFKIHVGAPNLPVYFFTDEDIEVLNSPQNFDPFPGYESTYNGVSATYPEPSAMWEMKDAPRYSNPSHVADDGEERLADVTFNAVPFADQVQRLMRSITEDNRRFRRHQLVLAPEAFALEPLDTVAWSSARNGYDAKLFPITAMEDLENCCQAVSIRESDPSDFDWSPSFELPWSVGSLAPNRPPAQTVTGWQVAPAILYDGGNNPRRPSIEVFFDGDLEDIRELRVQVRLAADASVVFDALIPYGDPDDDGTVRSVILNGTFLPNEPYEVRGRFIPYGGRETEWTAWLPVTTPNVLLGELDVYFDIDLEEIQEAVDASMDWIGPGARELQDRLLEVSEWAAEQDASDALDRQQLRREVVATAQGVEARFSESIDLVVTDVQSVAARTTDLEITADELADGQSILAADINSITAALGDYAEPDAIANAFTATFVEIEAVEGEVTALAGSLQNLSAEVDDVAASVTVRAAAAADPGGGYARWGVQVQLANGNWDSSAAFFLDTHPNQPSRFIGLADQFVFDTGSTTRRPFVIQGNALYADELNVNWANIVGANIQWADINNVNIGWADINAAVINNLTVVDGMIPAGLITSQGADSSSQTIPTPNSGMSAWHTVADVTLDSPSGNPITVFYNFSGSVWSGGQSNQAEIEVRLLLQSGVAMGPWVNSSTGGTASISGLDMVMITAGSGNQRLRLQARAGSNLPGASASISSSIVATVPRF